ncbi:MAG: pyridoxamine 5'-phosphate oxidase [Pseudomonadota bacterium]
MTSSLHHDPVARFGKWYADARERGLAQPEAMALATASATGAPAVRMVLLKSADREGFTFYTNTLSRKGRELDSNPRAALCFFWEGLGRQIRVEGSVVRVDDDEADAYFASRPRDSQLGAWASLQSELLDDRSLLESRLAEVRQRHGDGEVSRPPHWGGYRVVAERIEFWQQGEARLHHRELYQRSADGWTRSVLYP